jgi:hypothetical protein
VRSLVLLMMEEEQPEGLSARKLVVETAKHNVLTAYSANDGIDLLRRFPNINGVLVHARLLHKEPRLLAQVKVLAPRVPIILASPGGEQSAPEVTFKVDSHKPHQLVSLLADGFQVDVSN